MECPRPFGSIILMPRRPPTQNKPVAAEITYPAPSPVSADSTLIIIPAELSSNLPGVAPRLAWLRARFGGVPLPLDPSDFVHCMTAIRQRFETHATKTEANNIVEFGVQLHKASIAQAPKNDIHPAVSVPLEILLFDRIVEYPILLAAQAKYGGIPVPVEAEHFEACSNLVATIMRWGGKPTKVTAAQFWTEIVDATEYPRLARISVPAPKRRSSTSSIRTLVSA